jgi:hypothetical protein
MVASPSPGRRVGLSTRCWTCRTGGSHVRNRTTRLSNSAMLGWTRLCENTKSFVCQVMCVVRLCFLPSILPFFLHEPNRDLERATLPPACSRGPCSWQVRECAGRALGDFYRCERSRMGDAFRPPLPTPFGVVNGGGPGPGTRMRSGPAKLRASGSPCSLSHQLLCAKRLLLLQKVWSGCNGTSRSILSSFPISPTSSWSPTVDASAWVREDTVIVAQVHSAKRGGMGTFMSPYLSAKC